MDNGDFTTETLDPITYEPIHKDRIVSIHKQLYDANSLSTSIIYSYMQNEIAIIPHNREPFTKRLS